MRRRIPGLLHHDQRFGGAWFCCSNEKCGFYGDMLELAALAWDCKPQAALLRFAECGVRLPEEVQAAELKKYKEERAARRRFRLLWNNARERLITMDAAASYRLRMMFGFYHS